MYIHTPYHRLKVDYGLPWIKLLSNYELSGTTTTTKNPGPSFVEWQDTFTMDIDNKTFNSSRNDYTFNDTGWIKKPVTKISYTSFTEADYSTTKYSLNISILDEVYENESRFLSVPDDSINYYFYNSFVITDNKYFYYEFVIKNKSNNNFYTLYGRINLDTKEEVFYKKDFTNVMLSNFFILENFLYIHYAENNTHKIICIDINNNKTEQIDTEKLNASNISFVGIFSDGIILRDLDFTSEYRYIKVDKHLNFLQEIVSPNVSLTNKNGDFYNNLLIYSEFFDIRYYGHKPCVKIYDVDKNKTYVIDKDLDVYVFYIDNDYIYAFSLDNQDVWKDSGRKYGYNLMFSIYYMPTNEFLKKVCSDKYLISQ